MGSEKDLDEILDLLMEKVREYESQGFVIDKEEMSLFEIAYNVLNLIISKNVKVAYTVDSGFKGVGDISLIGKEIEFTDTDALVLVCKLASNINVYARLDGSVRMDFTFYGITKPKSS